MNHINLISYRLATSGMGVILYEAKNYDQAERIFKYIISRLKQWKQIWI